MDAPERTAERNLHALAMQKQTLEQQQTEITLALKELHGAHKAHKLVGGLLIETNADTLRADLERKLETTQARLAAIESQHKKLSEKTSHGRDH